MIKDIKEVISNAVKAGATVVNDVRVTNVSIYPAREGKNVDYWCTLTINAVIPGMIAEGSGTDITYKKGNTKTVTVPLGSIVTCLFDALIEMDNDDAIDLCDYKSILLADAEKEALAYCKSANEKNAAADDATAKASAYDAIMKAYQQNSASANINAAIG